MFEAFGREEAHAEYGSVTIMDTKIDNTDEIDRTVSIEFPDDLPQTDNRRITAVVTEKLRKTPSCASFICGIFGGKTVNVGELLSDTELELADDFEVSKGVYDDNFVDFHENFELKNLIADGGQGSVNNAIDRKLVREVAIKTLHKSLRDRNKCRNAFIAEARITGQLDHPAIVPVHGIYGDAENNLYLAMKLIRGNTLKNYLDKTLKCYRKMMRFQIARNEHRMLPQRLDIFLRVCEAIAYAHHKKVIHRDLKPENIMLGSFNETYVMDWGIAEHQTWKAPHGREKFSGTIQYAAPEIVNHQPYDSRSDIYSLGLILFELTYLKPAYNAKMFPEAMELARNCRVGSYSHRFHYRVDRDLVLIVRKALAPRPAERYQNVKALMADIRSYLRFDEISAHPDTVFGKIARSLRRKSRFLMFCWIFLLLAMTCASTYYFYSEMHRRDAARNEEAILAETYSQGVHTATRFDYRVHALESLLTTIAWETALLLESTVPVGSTTGEKLYSNLDTIPGDYADSPTYGRKIGLDTFAYYEAQGGEVSEIDDWLRKLRPLNRGLFQVVSQSLANVAPIPTGEQEQKEMIRELVKPPLSFVYAGFVNGLIVGYPYSADLRKDYDPRKYSWYRLALDSPNGQPVWSEPYIDDKFSPEGGKQELVVTVSQVIRGGDGKIFGVAGADVPLERLFELMRRGMSVSKGTRTQYLMDEEGRIIMGGGIVNKPEITPQGVKFKKIKDKELLKTMWNRRNGQIFRKGKGVDQVFFFQKIETFRWLYVEKIDFSKNTQSQAVNTKIAGNL
ncbi:MAG: protein kinase [Victivallales bacterium]|nr:protein kinase [Victivallales bacterium]